MKKASRKSGLIEIKVPHEQYQSFYTIAEDRTKDFVKRYLSGQQFPGSIGQIQTVQDLACAIYLQGIWDGTQVMIQRPELTELLK